MFSGSDDLILINYIRFLKFLMILGHYGAIYSNVNIFYDFIRIRFKLWIKWPYLVFVVENDNFDHLHSKMIVNSFRYTKSWLNDHFWNQHDMNFRQIYNMISLEVDWTIKVSEPKERYWTVEKILKSTIYYLLIIIFLAFKMDIFIKNSVLLDREILFFRKSLFISRI